MKKPPGTSGLMPVKGSHCGLRPDLDDMTSDTAFDFSGAAELLNENKELMEKNDENKYSQEITRKTSANSHHKPNG